MSMQKLLTALYGQLQAEELFDAITQRVEAFRREQPQLANPAEPAEQTGQSDAQDVILITYGDQFREPHHPPLQSLGAFLHDYLGDLIGGVHLLPIYPYSSDDGFSVIDYYQVAPELGTWQDVADLGESYRLVFDLVVNHVSAQCTWFQRFLAGVPPYTDYFIVLDPGTDLSAVVRPRATPVLTPFRTAGGVRHVWTTFSEDQIDLNFSNPLVLLEMIDVLLFYVARGAQVIRLDAIAYLWKVPGTSCIHLPQTHAVVKLLRAILDLAALSVQLLTETNVPHAENISYFGEYVAERGRSDEAQMVYQFPLGPLTLHTFLMGDSTSLTDWAQGLPDLPPGTAFFNFTASHDGVGVRPAEGLLSADEIRHLVETTLAHGGQVSYKSNPDGSQSPYELNVTWYDALNDPFQPAPALDVARFLASQAIMLCLAGVPGIYVHSLFGSHNCERCRQETGQRRSLNREKFQLAEIRQELDSSETLKSIVFSGYRHLLTIYRQQLAAHPGVRQRILRLDAHVFALLRTAADGHSFLCITNVQADLIQVAIKLSQHQLPQCGQCIDVLSGETINTQDDLLTCSLEPYQARWLVLQAGAAR
jgi:glucosylglycerate phosphorylase